MHGGLFLDVNGLHQIDLNLERAAADGADVFIHVFPLADKIASDFQPQHVHPQRPKPVFARAPNGDLLNAQHLEWAAVHTNSTIGWSTLSDSPLTASTLPTTPSAIANSTFSIFMASITATRSPACTF